MSQRKSTLKYFTFVSTKMSNCSIDASAQKARIYDCTYRLYSFTDEEIATGENS